MEWHRALKVSHAISDITAIVTKYAGINRVTIDVHICTMLIKLPNLGWLHSNSHTSDVAGKEIISDKKVRQGTRIWIYGLCRTLFLLTKIFWSSDPDGNLGDWVWREGHLIPAGSQFQGGSALGWDHTKEPFINDVCRGYKIADKYYS